MSSTIYISRKLFSLRDTIFITDELGVTIYEAANENILNPLTAIVTKNQNYLAKINRKLFSLPYTWEIKTADSSYMIKRKIFSLNRQLTVFNGKYNGAKISGNLIDNKFEITLGDISVAKIKSNIASPVDRSIVEIFDKSDEEFTAIAMVILIKSKTEDRRVINKI